MRAICILFFAAALAACDSSEKKLKEVAWGKTIEGDYDLVLERAKYVILKRFPKGFDPDRTDEDKGEFWTIWHFKTSYFYRGTTRERGHLTVEDLGDGNVRVGVAVVRQINDNIDNPHLIDEARWVGSRRDPEMEARIEASIARRYLNSGPSEQWKERNRGKRATIRQDLIDRYQDVDLDEASKLGRERDGIPRGADKFYGETDDPAWKNKGGFDKARAEREERRKQSEMEKEQEELKKKNQGK